MIYQSILVASVTVASFATNVLAGSTLLSRAFTSCGYVGGQIYCFGGDTDSVGGTIDSNIYSLNISQFVGQTTDSMSSQWNLITPAIPFDTELRRTPASAVLSDGKTFLIHGGHDMLYRKLTNQTISFDTSTETWSRKEPYIDGNNGPRQIYYSTAVNLKNDTIGFYGGIEQLANTSVVIVSADGGIMNYDSNNGSYVGYKDLEVNSPESNNWKEYSPQTSVPPNFYPNSQSATINPSSGIIYYFGGSFNTPVTNGAAIRVPFSWAYTFDTNLGSWSNKTFGGDIPSSRIYHTANMLPNTQDIILYGGTDNGAQASTDYCFTVNLLTNTWTQQNSVNVPSYLSGPRYSHSTVLVDSTLFVLFGRGLDGSLNPSLLTLDVSNATTIAYVANYNPSAGNTNNSTTFNSTSSNSTSSGEINGASTGLSKGAVAGIAVGCVIIGLAIIAFGIFCIRRKKSTEQQQQFESSKDNEFLHEPIHVDWDQIDKQYKEIPVASPILSDLDETTAVGSPATTADFLTSPRVHQYSPNLATTDTMEHPPYHFNKSPDTFINIVKPSVADQDYSVDKPHGM